MQRAIPPDLAHGHLPIGDGVQQHEAIGDLHLAADNFSGAVEEYGAALLSVGLGEPAERCRLLEKLAETETRGRLNAAGGLEAYPTTAPEFAALIRRDYDKYGKLVRDVGVKVD